METPCDARGRIFLSHPYTHGRHCTNFDVKIHILAIDCVDLV